METQKEIKSNQNKGVKRKLIEEEIDYLEQKRCCLQKDIVDHEKEADELAQKGEAKRDICFFIKSNSLRKTIKEKNSTVDEIAIQITAKKADLKNL